MHNRIVSQVYLQTTINVKMFSLWVNLYYNHCVLYNYVLLHIIWLQFGWDNSIRFVCTVAVYVSSEMFIIFNYKKINCRFREIIIICFIVNISHEKNSWLCYKLNNIRKHDYIKKYSCGKKIFLCIYGKFPIGKPHRNNKTTILLRSTKNVFP